MVEISQKFHIKFKCKDYARSIKTRGVNVMSDENQNNQTNLPFKGEEETEVENPKKNSTINTESSPKKSKKRAL